MGGRGWWFSEQNLILHSTVLSSQNLILGEGGGGQQAKPHLSWIGYYLEMEVINKADTKLFSLFYISKGKSMQINCIFSKMTKIHILTPCLWHPIWTTCWSLIFTKIDIKYLKIPLYNRLVCILCYCITCGLYKGWKLVKNGWKYKYLVIWTIGIWRQSYFLPLMHIKSAVTKIEGEGGGGQWKYLIFGGGGGAGQWAIWWWYFMLAKPHLSWIGYYLEMEVINKADTKWKIHAN